MAQEFGKVRQSRGRWRIDVRSAVRGAFLYSDRGLRFESEAHAESTLAAIRREISQGGDPKAIVRRMLPQDSKQMRVGVWLDRWLAYQTERAQAGELSPEHVRNLRRDCRATFAPLRERSIYSLKYGEIDDWLRALSVGQKTKRNAASNLRAFFGWLKRRGEINHVPDFPTVRVDEYLPTIIDPVPRARILEAIPVERRGAVLAACLGLRPSEVRALNIEDYRDGRLYVAHGMKGPSAGSPRRGTKTRQWRVVDAGVELDDWIRTYRVDAIGGPLFVNPTAVNEERRWIASALRQEWNRACRKVGIRVKMYEGTKHSSASAAARAGMPLQEIAKLVGHADLKSTQKYAKLAQGGSLLPLDRKPR